MLIYVQSTTEVAPYLLLSLLASYIIFITNRSYHTVFLSFNRLLDSFHLPHPSLCSSESLCLAHATSSFCVLITTNTQHPFALLL